MTQGQLRILASVAMAAMLGGCHHDEKASGHGTVTGQILPGSVSDAMLPYDSVKSKAPLAPEETVSPSASGTSDNPSDKADESAPAAAASAASAAPEIAASPTPPPVAN
ncbi:MAG: hypothetical protein M3N34_00710 [Pseudomonadota bacterium]|nr:hypothetical protein [Pseudomonadota bacterium]